MQITDERFAKHLNSLNREPKSVVLAYCLSDDWKSCNDIRNSYLSIVESKALTSDESNFSEYCHYSFLPSGFVQEKELPIEQTFGSTALRHSNHWRFTDKGNDTGKSAALLGLEATKNLKFSLYEVLGRVPYNRAKILLYLSKVKSARAKDLADATESHPAGIFHSCEKLAELGLLEYESCFEKGWSEYEWTGKAGEPRTVNQLRTATREVSNFMKGNPGKWEYNAVANKIGRIGTSVSTVLSGLERQGFTRKTKDFNASEKQSEVKIKDLGLELTEHFLRPVYEASDPTASRRYLDSFTGDLKLSRDDIVEAIKLYYGVSPQLNIVPRDDIEDTITELAKESNPPGLRPKDLRSMTGKNLNNHLRHMVATRKLTKEKEGKAVYYSLTEA